jgi:hypothetical protein
MVCILVVSRRADDTAAVMHRFGELARAAERHGFALADLRPQTHRRDAAEVHQVDGFQLFSNAASPTPHRNLGRLLRHALVLDACGLQARAQSLVARRAATNQRYRPLADGVYLRAAGNHGFGPLNPVAIFSRRASVEPPPPGWDRTKFPVLVSIHIQSNNPENLTAFCDRLANSCDEPGRIEIIVKIDDDHIALNELLPQEVARQPFRHRGRDGPYWPPPAQIRTRPTKASGSYLGCLTSKRSSGQG